MNYEKFDRTGVLCLPVLHFIIGQPFDELSRAFMESLSPTLIRVILPGHPQTTDSQLGRVTVYLSDKGTINEIEQEVRVGLPEGIEHGHALLMEAKRRGIDIQ